MTTRVEGRGATTQFVYGPNGMRHKQVRAVDGDTTTTHYVDGLYEVDTNSGEWRAYIGNTAVLSWTQENGKLLLFTLRDRLNSATTLVNQDGAVVSRRYFDPFGKAASGTTDDFTNLSINSDYLFTDLSETNQYRRGFTQM